MTLTTEELFEKINSLDFTRLLKKRSILADARDQAEAQVARFTPMTVEDRFRGFLKIGFRPHGMYVPDDIILKSGLMADVKRVGYIDDPSDRIREYFLLQDQTELWEKAGIPGKWTGQQAVARSTASFRLVAFGRRSGKSMYASREALVVALTRPRSVVWVAAPTFDLVSRVFDMMVEMVDDLGLETKICRNNPQDKLIVLENGSKIEGVSLDRPKSAAGAAVDLVIVDEAAQITEEAWLRAVLPPLADRNGQALLISSWEGEEGFFHDKYADAQADGSSSWQVFCAPSWENFFEFPRGRSDPKVIRAEKEMGSQPLDFLEQFGAIASRAKGRVYHEFREKVHVGDFTFKKDHPVICAADPSGGANPYAVIALQDFGDITVQIDEFYETGVLVEKIAPILDKKPWRENVTDLIVDSAWPADIERWNTLGWPAYGVPNKPKEEESIPYVRRLLRDPVRFHTFYRRKMNEVLAEQDLPPDSDRDMPPETQRTLAILVEERISDENLSEEDILEIRSSSRLFIARHCVSTIREFKFHKYRKRRAGLDLKEKPEDSLDHCLDSIRYFAHIYKRYDGDTPYPQSYLTARNILWEPPKDTSDKDPTKINNTVAWTPGYGFLPEVRGRILKNTSGVRSYLVRS